VKVLISGAAGFLGSAFFAHHKAAGDEVIGFDVATDRPEGVYHFEATDFFSSSEREFDLAYHFAATVLGRVVIENDPLLQAENAGLDAAFFRWAVGHTRRAVYPSSSAVYGIKLQEGKGLALSEDMFRPDAKEWHAPDAWYGTEKLMAEYLAWTAAMKYDLNVLCLRPFSGYGPGQSLDYPVPSICLRALHQEDPLTVWGSGHQTRDFVYIDDLVGATIARLTHDLYRYVPLNVGTGVPISFVDIAKMAAEIVGYRPKIVTDANKPEGVQSRYADPSQMLRYYRPTISLYEGLQRTMANLIPAH
jgi:nucleoside-diphosphate-sugar epimerase